MSRPLPQFPRGPRRTPVDREKCLLAIPRVSPQWELQALKALMKPQAGDVIRHRSGRQKRPRNLPATTEQVRGLIAARLQTAFDVHFPPHGDYWFIAEFPRALLNEARALALVLSRRLPGIWLTVDRAFVLDTRFFRRERGYKLRLVEATNIHLPRAIRSALRDELDRAVVSPRSRV